MDKDLVKYDIPIYGGEFWIGFADDFTKFGKEHDMDINETSNGCIGLTLRNIDDHHAGKYCILIKNNKIRPDIIAHEAIHLANYLFEDRGVRHSLKDDEHFAYFVDWVVQMVFQAVYKLKKIIKIKVDGEDIVIQYPKKSITSKNAE